MSMIRKYHINKPQTTLWHREEDMPNHLETPGRQIKQSNQLSLPHQDDCNTRTSEEASKATSSLFPIKMIAILEHQRKRQYTNCRCSMTSPDSAIDVGRVVYARVNIGNTVRCIPWIYCVIDSTCRESILWQCQTVNLVLMTFGNSSFCWNPIRKLFVGLMFGLGFIIECFVAFLVWQSSQWGKESWLLRLICYSMYIWTVCLTGVLCLFLFVWSVVLESHWIGGNRKRLYYRYT